MLQFERGKMFPSLGQQPIGFHLFTLSRSLSVMSVGDVENEISKHLQQSERHSSDRSDLNMQIPEPLPSGDS